MKLLSTVLILLLLVTATVTNAQQKQAPYKALQFRSFNTVGLIDGEAVASLQLLTINGVQYHSWFAGIGAGIDYYRLRTIPLFVDIRKSFLNNSLFVYGDAGVNFYWHRDKDVKQFYINDKVKGGFYGEAGIGYLIKLHKNTGLQFSAGYSYKKLTENGTEEYWVDPGFPGPSNYNNKINYNLNRLVLKAGIAF